MNSLQKRRDPRMRGELAAWLYRVEALPQQPTDIAQPYDLEIAGDWRGAAQMWQSLGCAYEQASLLGWNGTEEEQRNALTIFDQLGAGPAAAMLRKRMRELGVRGVPRGLRDSTRSNPHGLTKREAEILELLSEGLRNSSIAKRLFLSPKTVDHHVSAILAKLGVPSRAEAVALVRKNVRLIFSVGDSSFIRWALPPQLGVLACSRCLSPAARRFRTVAPGVKTQHLHPAGNESALQRSMRRRDAWVWAPLVGAATLQIDNWDHRISDWARTETPIFGSTADAERWSDDLRSASFVAFAATVAFTPSGSSGSEWLLNKAKGFGVQLAAVAVATGTTRLLKDVTNRERPSGADDESFPSGHTTSSAVHTRLASREPRLY